MRFAPSAPPLRNAPSLETVSDETSADSLSEVSKWEGLTTRSVLLGLCIGTLTTVENIYFAIKYGWTTTNNISAAILGFGAVKALNALWPRRAYPFTPAENCVLMTVAVSATAVVCGTSMPFAILAMGREIRDADGFEGDSAVWQPKVTDLLLYSAALCYVGFFLSIPLRRKFVIREPLPFPYSVAAARTIQSLHASSDNYEPTLLVKGLVPAFVLALTCWCVDGLERLPLFGLIAMRKSSWQLNLQPAPFGHGFIVPARFILSEVLGACVASGGLLKLANMHEGTWYAAGATGFEGRDAYYLMPAILVVCVDSVYQLIKITFLFIYEQAKQRRDFQGSRRGGHDAPLLPGANAEADVAVYSALHPADFPRGAAKEPRDDLGAITPKFWLGGWFLASAFASLVFVRQFECRWSMVLVAVISSPLWSIGITMAVGVTGSNVASSCGKVMIMLFAAWYGSPHVLPTLALGALAIAVIDQALDLVRDFKTAQMLLASPWAMLAAQLIGATTSIFTSSFLYSIYVNAISVPTPALPATIAKSYRALAFVFAGGVGKLPQHCLSLSALCGGVALMFNFVHDFVLRGRPNQQKRCPNAIAFGIGIYLLPGQTFASLFGLGAATVWRFVDPASAEKRSEIVGAAFLAGDGLAGVVTSVLEVNGLKPPFSLDFSKIG